MATFHEGGMDMLEYVAYSEPHPNVIRFVEQGMQQATHYVSDMAQSFMDTTRAIHEEVMSSDAMRKARGAARQLSRIWQRDEIRPLLSVGDLQAAPNTMVRWIMAEPTVREYYHDRRCEGYGEEYVDNHPGKIGADHPDYQQVMNGIVEFSDDEQTWSATSYTIDYDEDERELYFEEQVDILRSWESVKQAILNRKDDPTSRWNAEL